MTRANPLFNSINAGEFSKRLHARSDFSKYPNGLEICLNLIPLAEGGAMRRSSTRYVAALKSSAVRGRVKGFQYSTTQAYMLEFGAAVLRFYRFQAQIAAADITGSITNGTFASDVASWDDKDTGVGAVSSWNAAGYMALLGDGTESAWRQQTLTSITNNGVYTLKFRVIGSPGDKVKLRVGTSDGGTQIVNDREFPTGYHCYTFTATATTIYLGFRHSAAKSLGIDDVSFIDGTAVEIDTPYAEADLPTIEGPQSADVLYLFHSTYPTYKLERYAHNSWSLVEVDWADGPYLDMNATATTLTPSAATGLGITITASAITGINSNEGFKTTDVGRLVRIDNPAAGVNWGYARITGFTSTTVVTADVKRAFGATSADARWRLGSWSATTGYPSCGEFFEQRLFAAANTNQPQTFWATQTGDIENHSPDSPTAAGLWDGTVEDDDALDYTISANKVQAIRWLSPGEDTLVIGTMSGEWVPSSTGAVLTPSDIAVRQQTTHGSAQVQPVRVGSIVLFVQRAKRKLREFGFSFETNGFQAPDMTRLAQHITKGGIRQIAFAEEPNSLLWAVREDGVLLSMTYRREEDVVGWARHIIGGELYGSITKVWQVDDSAETFTDETTDANDAGNADWTVFPATEAVGDYAAFGSATPFSELVFDYANGTAGVGGTVTWEYWDGSAWTALSGVTDNTTGFTVAVADDLHVTWTEPSDWAKRRIDSGPALYYIRAKVATVYTTNPVLDQGFIPGDAAVESVAVIPGADGAGQVQSSEDRDEVWLIVKRTINGATKRYIEVMERDYETGDDQEDAYYADSIITYDSTAATSITGLDHLEGETVKVLADGAIAEAAVVTSGAITLATAASVVQVGLGYTHRGRTLKIEAGAVAGTALGKTKVINGITFIVVDSATLSFGPDSDNLQDVDFRVVSDAMDSPAPLFTGERYYEFETGWKEDIRINYESDDPVPFMLIALAPEIVVNDVK